MLKRQTNSIKLSRRLLPPAAIIAVVFWLGSGPHGIALAQAPYNDPTTAEGWAWSKISKGEWADFNQHCDPQAPQLDPKVDDVRWQKDCRKITASFLQNLLTRAPWRESIPFAGVRINGALIVSNLADPKDLDLKSAKLKTPIENVNSQIQTDINLMEAQTDDFISINSCLITGKFSAEAFRSTSELALTDDEILSVNLNDAKIDGNVDMWGTHLNGEFEATALHVVNGSLDMSSSAKDKSWFEKAVKLDGAKVAGNVQMFGAVFGDALVASYLQVGGYLSMARSVANVTKKVRKSKVTKELSLNNAKISGFVDLGDTSFGDKLNADYLDVGSYLSMQKANFADTVNMGFVKISGPLIFNDAKFDGTLDAYHIQVGGYVSMQKTIAGNVKFPFAKFDNNLDLRNATLGKLDLSGGSIAGDLQLASKHDIVKWNEEGGELNLRNARIGNLTDEEQAWPKKCHLLLNGATFDHLGGHQGETEREMLRRGAPWWDENWARLNPQYSPSPYAQLAAAFTALGDRDSANEIRYLARERERDVAWDEFWDNGKIQATCVEDSDPEPQVASGDGRAWWAFWTRLLPTGRAWGAFGTWLLLSVLKYVAGYGIGRHTFCVIYWVLGFSLVGAVILYFTVPEARKFRFGRPDRVRGALWCFGASLNRLLPVIELKEFKWDFERLELWQRVAFSILGLIGWILGGILVLAVSGLTQNP